MNFIKKNMNESIKEIKGKHFSVGNKAFVVTGSLPENVDTQKRNVLTTETNFHYYSRKIKEALS